MKEAKTYQNLPLLTDTLFKLSHLPTRITKERKFQGALEIKSKGTVELTQQIRALADFPEEYFNPCFKNQH